MTERERKAFNRGLEMAARIANFWQLENFRLCNDTILHDPILNKSATRETLVADMQKSRQLMMEGHAHATAAHVCGAVADEIRAQKVKKPP